MALANYLENIKSSGIYRFVFEKSDLPAEQAETMRLFVGYSEKGPFNTPVYFDSISDYKKVFGDVNKKLERYGDYFHRSCIQGLANGPILALNLKHFSQENFKTFDQQGRPKALSLRCTAKYVRWTEATEATEGTPAVLYTQEEYDEYIALNSEAPAWNVGDVKVPAVPGTEATESHPEDVNVWEVFVKPALIDAGYMDANEVLTGLYHKNGNAWTVTELKNSVLAENAFESSVDSWETVDDFYTETSDPAEITFIAEDDSSLFMNGEVVNGISFDANRFDKNIYASDAVYDKSRFWYLDPKTLKSNASVPNYLYMSATDSENCSNTVFIKSYVPKGYNITFKEWYSTVMNGEELPSYLEPVANDKLQDYFVKVYVFGGEFTPELVSTDFYKKFFTVEDGKVMIKKTVKNSFGEYVDALDTFAANSKSNAIGVYQGIVLPDFVTVNNSPLSIVDVFNSDNSKHKMMMYADLDGLYDESYSVSDLKMMNRDGGASIFDYSSVADEAPSAEAIYLRGYIYENAKPTDSTSDSSKLEWQNKILDALKGIDNGDGTYTGYKGLRIGLTDRKSVVYHYLVDTFDTYISAQMKSILANICKEKENSVAILNFPKSDTVKSFVNPTDESGNQMFLKNSMIDFSVMTDPANSAIVSLADEDNGGSFAGYYTAAKLKNPVTGQNYLIPSAALVSNAFMEKYVTRLPYSVVAGPNYGKITVANLVGPDYNYCEEDRNELEPYGVNVLLYVPNKGTYINSNQTAKQNPVTALSRMHIRELVIFLQDEIENLLQNYQWEFNTQQLRDTIKAKADVILQTCKYNKGIYAFTTQCDEKNNTPEVIDNDMLILDYAIEPSRGAGKMVQQLTIYKTGGLTSVTMN